MEPENVKLKSTITWVQGSAMTIGAVLGSGVFVLPVAAAVLAGPASLVAWILMGLLAIPLAMTLGYLASSYPDAGGIASYARQAFGPRAGAIAGWLFLGTVPIGGPITALIGANYLGAFLALTSLQINLLAGLMLFLALFFNYQGIELSGAVQVGIISTIALILSAAILAALPQVELRSFTPFAPQGWWPVGVAMTRLFWAFVGWEMIVHLAEEFKNPQRDIPVSLGTSIGIINLLYLSLAFVTIGTQAYLGPQNTAALVNMVAKGWGGWAGIITAFLGVIVCYGTIHTYVAGFSRLVFAQARQGDFPAYFAKLHPQSQVPHRVLLVLGPIFALVLLLNYWLQFDIGFLMQWPSSIFILLYVIGMAAAIKILPKPSLGRYYAMISLVMCLGVYFFTGWVGIYPLILAAIGWLSHSYYNKKG